MLIQSLVFFGVADDQSLLRRKIPRVSCKQRWHVVWDNVDFASNVLGLSRLQAAYAEVRVKAASDTLKEFLIGCEGDGEELFLVAAKAADEAVAGDQLAERARIHVGTRHVLGTPDLAGDVASFFDPRLDVAHPVELAVEEEEALGQVVVDILAFIVIPGEVTEADAGLRPVRDGGGHGGIVSCDGKGDIVGTGGYRVIDDDAVFDGAPQLHGLLVLAEREEFCRVADGGVVPVGISGVGAAIRFKVVDANLTLRQMRALDDEPVLVAGESQVGDLRECEAGSEREEGKE
jgi:hypothetical protein